MSKKQSRSLLVWTSSFMWLGCLFDPGDAKGLPCRNDADCGPKLACIGDICGGDDDDDDDDDQNPSAGSADTMTQGGTTGTTPPECAMVGESCEGTPCCADSACVDFGTGTSPQILWPALGNAGSNCLSCCCQPPPGGQSVCVFQDFCDGDISSCNAGSCSLGGSLCSSSTDCCNGLCN